MRLFLAIPLLFGLSFHHLYGIEYDYSDWSARDIEPTTDEIFSYDQYPHLDQDYRTKDVYGYDHNKDVYAEYQQASEKLDNLLVS